MFADLRYSIRSLAKQPSFVAAAVLVLGLAVGVNTAVFSLINSLLLRPLAVRAPHELGFVYPTDERGRSVSYEAFLNLRESLDVFAGLAARARDAAGLRAGNDLVPLVGESVTANYFDVLGVAPRIGRTFESGEESAGATPVAIISEAVWRSRFGADAAIVGRTLRITGPSVYSGRYSASRDYTIVGVMGSPFRGTGSAWQPADYWVLLPQRYEDHRAARPNRASSLSDWPVVPIGRLRDGVTFAQAQAAVNTAGRDIIRRTSRDRVRADESCVLMNAPRVRLPFSGAYFLSVPRLALALMAIATLLMAIAAMNLAGMLFARGVARRTEIAVRLSLGASRARLIRQLLAESFVLAVCGTAAGLLLARLLVVMALREIPRQMPGVNATLLTVDVPVDARVFGFAALTCLVTALLVGLAPAAASVRGNLLSALMGTGIVAARVGRSRMRRLILVPQIALSVVLLLVSGVMVRSLLRQEMAPPGYDAEQVVILQVQFPAASPPTNADERSAESEKLTMAFDRIVERVAALPEVSSVAVSEMSIQGVGLPEMGSTVIARSDDGTPRTPRGATHGYVSPDYFKTMGIPLLRGRPFDARDMKPDPRTAIVSERLATELWPGKDPIGEAFAHPYSPASRYPTRWFEVIGVAKSATLPLEEFPRPVFYVPITSNPEMGSNILVRGTGNPAQLIVRVKEAIAQADDAVLVSQARPLADAVDAIRSPRRFSTALLGASGIAGLILAALGVFGLMSYAVAQRLGEIGVRMVLGARRPDVIRLILLDGAGVVIAGIVIGFALAFAALRYASHAVIPLPDADGMTFIVVPLLLAASVLLACYLPARRAARVDPLVVLRQG
jgi:putative ABC transport system permease protein